MSEGGGVLADEAQQSRNKRLFDVQRSCWALRAILDCLAHVWSREMMLFENARTAAEGAGRLSLTSLSVQPASRSADELSSDIDVTLQHACVHWPWIAATRSALQAGHDVLKKAGLQQLGPESWKVSTLVPILLLLLYIPIVLTCQSCITYWCQLARLTNACNQCLRISPVSHCYAPQRRITTTTLQYVAVLLSAEG